MRRRREERRRAGGDGAGGLLIYDGDCGFCTTAARWAEKGFERDDRIEAWQFIGQPALGSMGLTVDDVQQAAWWIGPDGTSWRGHRAIGKALEAGRGWRRPAGWLVLAPPVSWLAARVYRVVVKYRYRLPGGTPACRVAPAPPRSPET